MALIFGGTYEIVAVVVIVIVAVGVRLFLMKKTGLMRAKCPNCGAVFDSSRTFGINLGPYRQIKCPACEKTSFMNIFVKTPTTWPAQEKQQVTSAVSEEDLEKKRIEDSKFEKE